MDVTGNISGTNGTFGGNIGAVNGSFSWNGHSWTIQWTLQYNVQTGAGLTGGLFNNTANRIFGGRSRFRFLRGQETKPGLEISTLTDLVTVNR